MNRGLYSVYTASAHGQGLKILSLENVAMSRGKNMNACLVGR